MPATIERIEVRGNTHTRDKTIRRALQRSAHEPCAAADLGPARRRIDALGYFDRVDVSMRPGSSSGLVAVEVDVHEKPLALGAGFSSADHFIAEVRMSQASGSDVPVRRPRRARAASEIRSP